MDETRESKFYVNRMDTNEDRDRLNTESTISQAPQMQHHQQQEQQPHHRLPLISRKREFKLIQIQKHPQKEHYEKPPALYNPSIWVTWMWKASLSVLILAILPSCVTSSDYECGINRFNNESPLTERIVGGNNSLQ